MDQNGVTRSGVPCSGSSGGSDGNQSEQLRAQDDILRSQFWSEDIDDVSQERDWDINIYSVQIGAQQGRTKLCEPTSQMYSASGPRAMRPMFPHFSSRSLLEPQVLTLMTYRVEREQEQATCTALMLSVALNGP